MMSSSDSEYDLVEASENTITVKEQHQNFSVRYTHTFSRENHAGGCRDVCCSPRALFNNGHRLFASISNYGEGNICVFDPQSKNMLAKVDVKDFGFKSDLKAICFADFSKIRHDEEEQEESSRNSNNDNNNECDPIFSLLLASGESKYGVFRFDAFPNPQYNPKYDENEEKEKQKKRHENYPILLRPFNHKEENNNRTSSYGGETEEKNENKLDNNPYFISVNNNSSSPPLLGVVCCETKVMFYNLLESSSSSSSYCLNIDTGLQSCCGVDFSESDDDLVCVSCDSRESCVAVISLSKQKVLCTLSPKLISEHREEQQGQDSVIRASFTKKGNFIACAGSNRGRIRVYGSSSSGGGLCWRNQEQVKFCGFIGQRTEEGKKEEEISDQEISALAKVDAYGSNRVVAATGDGTILVADCASLTLLVAFNFKIQAQIYGMTASNTFLACACDNGHVMFASFDPFEARKIVFLIAERSGEKTKVGMCLNSIYVLKILVARYLA